MKQLAVIIAVSFVALAGIVFSITYWSRQDDVDVGFKIMAVCMQSTGILLVFRAVMKGLFAWWEYKDP